MPFEGLWALGESSDPDEAEMILRISRVSDRIYELIWEAEDSQLDGIGLEHQGSQSMSFYCYPSDEDLDDEDLDDEDLDDEDLDELLDEGVEISVGYFTLSGDGKELVETSALPSSDEITEVRYTWISSLDEAEQIMQQ